MVQLTLACKLCCGAVGGPAADNNNTATERKNWPLCIESSPNLLQIQQNEKQRTTLTLLTSKRHQHIAAFVIDAQQMA